MYSEGNACVFTHSFSLISGISSQRKERKERTNRKLQPVGTELSSFVLNSFLRFKNVKKQLSKFQ